MSDLEGTGEHDFRDGLGCFVGGQGDAACRLKIAGHRHELPPTTAALAVAAQHFERAYSPIVLAGFVRVIEVALWSSAIGLILYLGLRRAG